MRVPRSVRLSLLVGTLVLAACGGGSAGTGASLDHGTYPMPDGPGGDVPDGPTPQPGDGAPTFPELSGGVLVTVDTQGEVWRWWVTNTATAALLEQAWEGTYTRGFYGRLRAGDGEAGHNAPWSWHADPESNGGDRVFFQPPQPGSSPNTPSACENQLEHWLTKDTDYVPHWPFVILAFDDRRP